jgi:hypothetical protein
MSDVTIMKLLIEDYNTKQKLNIKHNEILYNYEKDNEVRLALNNTLVKLRLDVLRREAEFYTLAAEAAADRLILFTKTE